MPNEWPPDDSQTPEPWSTPSGPRPDGGEPGGFRGGDPPADGSLPPTFPWPPPGGSADEPAIPGYAILSVLGRGGMGVVYLARQLALNRIVALKMILMPLGIAPEKREELDKRFRIEAEAVARLQHANIVQIYDFGTCAGNHYLALELLEGGSLAKRLTGTLLKDKEAALLVEQLARAMEVVHEKGIVHRDLKPHNVLLAWDGTPKIGDFGLAKRLDVTDGLTPDGTVLGTPAYMAPEQAAGRVKEIGPAADTYALGVILYEVLTGRPPFRAATVMETLLKVLQEEPISPAWFVSLKRDLETICLKCLRKEAGKRYASALALAEDLRRFLDGKPIKARPVSATERVVMWARRRPALATLLGVTMMALLSLGLLWAGLRRQARSEQARTQVQRLAGAAPEAVPYALAELAPLRDEALPLLRGQFADATTDPGARLRLASGLAALGESPDAFLVDAILRAPASAGKCKNIVTALASGKEQACVQLRQRFKDETDPAARVRRAVVLLHLGDPEAAKSMLALDADPQYRTAFIHGYASWHGNLLDLPALLRAARSGPFRSGLCSAVATLDPALLSGAERQALREVLAELYTREEDSGSHAAAGQALRRWRSYLPALRKSRRPATGREWFVNKQGMTMVRVHPGTFTMGDPDEDNTTDAMPAHRVTLQRPYFLCDREVSVDLFRLFATDRDHPEKEKPQGWAPKPKISPEGGCPAQRISWHEAVLFCNWLSRKEGRTPCYERASRARGKDPDGKKLVSFDVWRCDFAADGYRLPTEAEWEYACRAGTATHYVFGNDETLLSRYGVYSSGFWIPTAPGGSLLPNGWGFFDMHGNVWEWCWDWYGSYSGTAQADPGGPEQSKAGEGYTDCRVVRGGGVCNSSGDWRSASRGYVHHLFRSGNTGFRVACTIKDSNRTR